MIFASLFGGSDEELMLRVKTVGDPRAFATLVGRWEKPIYRLCTRMTGDPHRGEDLKQETFARLFTKRHLYQPTGRFLSYLWRMALNVCHDELRRINRCPEIALLNQTPEAADANVDFAAGEPGPDICAAQAEEGELVRQALMRLPEIYRSVLVLRHYQRLKLSEIAETLEVPVGTVNSRMAEALARLTRLLEPELDRGHPRSDSARPERLAL